MVGAAFSPVTLAFGAYQFKNLWPGSPYTFPAMSIGSDFTGRKILVSVDIGIYGATATALTMDSGAGDISGTKLIEATESNDGNSGHISVWFWDVDEVSTGSTAVFKGSMSSDSGTYVHMSLATFTMNGGGTTYDDSYTTSTPGNHSWAVTAPAGSAILCATARNERPTASITGTGMSMVVNNNSDGIAGHVVGIGNYDVETSVTVGSNTTGTSFYSSSAMMLFEGK
jgi:hypothetical protein